MPFNEQLPEWQNEGTQPPQSKRVEGWQPNEKPPASWFNWLFGRTYRVLKELQEKAALNTDLSALDQRQTNHENNKNNPHNVTKQQVGLGNVDNVQQIPMSQKGQPNGVATLDDMGKVPSSQLPDIAAPVTSVNGKTGDVQLTASDVGAPTAQQHDQLEQKLADHKADFVSVDSFGSSKNSETIQAALNFAKSRGGGIVYVPPGTYNITSTLRIPSNTFLVGIGQVVFKRAANINAITINDSDGMIGGYDANQNIVVDNIIFDANPSEFPSTSITLLAFGHARNIEIRNCRFTGNNTSWHDLELNACKDVLVYRCFFDDYRGTSEILQLDFMGSAAQFPWFGPYDDTACENITVEKCVFKEVPSAVRTKTAIGNHTFKEGVVTKNFRIKECYFDRFWLAIRHLDVQGLFIEGNRFINCLLGVVFSERENDCYGWHMVGNYFDNSMRDSDASYDEGRFFWGETQVLSKTFSKIRIKDNFIKDSIFHGIGFTCSSDAIIEGNFIEKSGRNGIYLFGGSNILAQNNVIKESGMEGTGWADIRIGHNSDTQTIGVTVSGNRCMEIQIGNNISGVLVTNNSVSGSIEYIGSASANVYNNQIAGVWTP